MGQCCGRASVRSSSEPDLQSTKRDVEASKGALESISFSTPGPPTDTGRKTLLSSQTSASLAQPSSAQQPQASLDNTQQQHSRGSPIDTTGVSAVFLRQFISLCRSRLSSSFLDRATTHDICEKLVKPDTHPQGSYVKNYPMLSNVAQGEDSRATAIATTSPQKTSHLGPANVFVSHAWRYRFIDVAQAMLDYQEDNPDTTCYFWFDLFVNDQNNATNNDFDWWCTAFRSSIESIGKVMLVLSPYDNPIPLTRAWCLWEILCAIDGGDAVDLIVQLPRDERHTFRVEVIMHGTSIAVEALMGVQAERAEATNPADKEMIFRAIEAIEGGFEAVNAKIKRELRAWLLDTALSWTRRDERAVSDDAEEEERYLSTCVSVAQLLHTFGDYERARHIIEGPLQGRQHEPNTKHSTELAEAYDTLANACSAKGDYDMAVQLLVQACRLSSAPSDSTRAADDVDGAIDDDEARLVTASCHSSLAYAYVGLEDFDRAIASANKALSLLPTTDKDGTPVEPPSEIYNVMAQAYEGKGDIDTAASLYEKTLAIVISEHGERHPGSVGSLIGLGNVYSSKGETDLAIHYYDQALNVVVATFGSDHPDASTIHMRLGHVYASTQTYDQAIDAFQAALKGFEAAERAATAVAGGVSGEKHSGAESLDAYQALASVYSDSGDFDRATKYYRKCLELSCSVFGEEHSQTAAAYLNLGVALRDAKGRETDAVDCHESALRVFLATAGQESADVVNAYNELGRSYTVIGSHDKAIQACNTGLSLALEHLGTDHPYTAESYNNLADALRDNGDYEQAWEYYGKALELWRHLLDDEDDPLTATTLFGMALLAEKTGNNELASQLGSEAHCILLTVCGPDHVDTQRVENLLKRLS